MFEYQYQSVEICPLNQMIDYFTQAEQIYLWSETVKYFVKTNKKKDIVPQRNKTI